MNNFLIRTIIILSVLTVLFFPDICKAQDYNIIDSTQYIASYNYEYHDDSLNHSEFKTDFMTLYIGKVYTDFEHEGKFYRDSLTRIFNSGASKALEADLTTKALGVRAGTHFTRYKLLCKLNTDSVVLAEKPMGSNKIKVTEAEKINWILDNKEEKEISNYHCKKATANFRGRGYTAWYTLDIPISEGPYKFRGLPGLIVKVEDSQSQHSFLLSSFYKSTIHRPIFFDSDTYEEVSMREYYKGKKTEISTSVKMYYDGTIKFTGSITTDELTARMLRKNNYIERL